MLGDRQPRSYTNGCLERGILKGSGGAGPSGGSWEGPGWQDATGLGPQAKEGGPVRLLPLVQLRSQSPTCIRHQDPCLPEGHPVKLGRALKDNKGQPGVLGTEPPTSQDNQALQGH